MAVQDGLAFWNALKVKIHALVKQENSNCMKCARYDVTTAPDGSVIGVRLPEGATEILIPYSKEVADATVGDTVLVIWHGTLSTAKAYYYGNGYEGYEAPEPPPAQFTEYLNVFADVGASVTATYQSTTYSGTVSSSGVITFTVLVQGTYTVTSTYNGNTKTATVAMTVSGATQTVDLRSTQSFIARLFIMTQPNATISVASRTGGSATYSGTTSELGILTLTVYEADTYRVTASVTKSSITYTDYKDVTVSENEYTYDVSIPLPVPVEFVEYMNVYADVGSSVTAVCGQTTYSGTISSAGHLTFTVFVAGTYTVTASLSGVTHTQTISMTVNGATQNVDLRSSPQQFIAYLTVSTNPDADITIEHSTSGTRYTGKASSSGVATFTIYESGTFTVYASTTDGNTSKDINMSTNGYMYNIDVTVIVKNCYVYAVGNSGETIDIQSLAGATFTSNEELRIVTLHIGGLLDYGTGGSCLSLGHISVDGIDESITPFDFRCSKWNFCAFMYGRTDPYAVVIADDGNGHRFEGTATKSGYVCFVAKNSGTYTVTSAGVTGTQTATLYVQDNSTIYRFDFRQFDGTLFNNGDEYTKYTGGWIGDSTVTVTDYDSSVYVYTSPIVSHTDMLIAQLMGGPKVGSLRTVNKLDLTYYETLTIEYAIGSGSGTGTVKLFATTGTSGVLSKASTTLTNSTTKTTATLDISQLSGNYYIGIEIEADNNQSMVFDLYYAAITLSENIEVSGGGGLSL